MNIYQIYFNKSSENNCFKESEKIKGVEIKVKEDIKKNPFFENKYIAEIISGDNIKDNEYYGVLSHKFTRKTGFTYRDLELLDFNKDVVSFFRHIRPFKDDNRNVLSNLNKWHSNGITCLNRILWGLGRADMIGVIPDTVIYQNHFLAKGKVYKSYVNDWLIPSIEMCELDEDLKSLLWEDSGYTYALHFMGFDYPHHTFVLERLFMLYCKHKGIEVQQEKPKMI